MKAQQKKVTQTGETTLWYAAPAKEWTEALPVGNGKLGAMVFGGTEKERIQLNEDSVWSGGPMERDNPDSLEYLEDIRGLLREGKISEAEQRIKYSMTGIPDGQRTYQTLGELYIELTDTQSVEPAGYHRELDLTTALNRTEYTLGGVTYTRSVLASYPDNVIAVHLTAEHGTLNFNAKIARRRHENKAWAQQGHTLAYTGGSEGLSFCCMLRGTTDGSIKTVGEYLLVEHATKATLYLTAATTYREENPINYCKSQLEKAATKGYYAILKDHLQDYQPLFETNSLWLSGEDTVDIPTDKRLEHFKESKQDNGLLSLYYAYGRYLLLSSSRPGSLPANLQGVWCQDMSPSWDSKYTININTEMNYWPAEICGLSQCHQPLFQHLKLMYENGKKTAKTMYGARGWVAHHNTDLWGDTAPQDTYIPSTFWVMGGAWLCMHLWEHYLYTLDQEFLAEHYYLMKDAALFLLDYMIENKKGDYIISPTVSPENTYKLPHGESGRVCAGCAMDGQIMADLFGATVAAAEVLQQDSEFAEQLTQALAKLPPTQIGSDGRIMEWTEEYQELEPGHRHISHLYALFPGTEISPSKTPALAAAAKETLAQRLAHGGGHTGWSRAWIINFWAMLEEPEKTEQNIHDLLAQSTYPNLFDSHPPFQIDGNFGGITGMVNAVLQSSPDGMTLLPALPPSWQTGALTGARVKGNAVVTLVWKEGELTSLTITAGKAYQGTIVYRGKALTVSLVAGENKVITPEDFS